MYEGQNEIGVAHFLEHIVMDGTRKYPTEKEISNLIEDTGGYRNASTNKENIEYSVKVLKENIKSAFEYLSEIVINPLIKEEDIEKQKKIIEQEILRFKGNPEEFSQRLIYSALFPNTRLGGLNTGDIDDIKKITRESLLSYHNRTHNAGNMVLSVSGDITKEKVQEFAELYMSSIKSGEKILPINLSILPRKEYLFEKRSNLKQAILTVGYQGLKRNDNDYYALELLFSILLGGSSSRLKQEIREKRALSYIVSGNNFSGRNSGIFTIRIGLDEKNILECLNIINLELKKIINGEVTKDELSKSLFYIKSSLKFTFENSLSEASYYSSKWCSTGFVNTLDKEIEFFELCSKDLELIKNVAKRFLSIDPSILIIGSENIEPLRVS
jgi:predicted Zn-dependent peptidase